MFEESRENTGGVIAGMLRSLEDGHLDIVPSAELKKAELAASPANSSSDEVLEMAGDFNYDGYAEAMLLAYNRKCKYPLKWTKLYEKNVGNNEGLDIDTDMDEDEGEDSFEGVAKE